MNLEAMENILNDMVIALDEFKSEDVKYYKRQVSRIMKYARELANEK